MIRNGWNTLGTFSTKWYPRGCTIGVFWSHFFERRAQINTSAALLQIVWIAFVSPPMPFSITRTNSSCAPAHADPPRKPFPPAVLRAISSSSVSLWGAVPTKIGTPRSNINVTQITLRMRAVRPRAPYGARCRHVQRPRNSSVHVPYC